MNWLGYFKKSDLIEDIIKNEIFDRNVQYLSVLSFFAIPVNIFHILVFYSNLDKGNDIEYVWRWGIISAHSILLIFFSIFGILFNYYKRRKNIRKEVIQFLIYVAFLVINSFGVAIVIIDQLVTSAITPFLFMCIAVPLIFLLRPIASVLLLVSSYILFYFFLPLTQFNPQILLSNRVNGFSFIGVGLFLSIIMWNNSLKRFQQERIIKNQKMDLEKNYRILLDNSEKLKIANATKDKFFSIIGHDLRSPFNSILGFSELIQMEYSEGIMENIIEYNNLISTSAKQAHLLLENLLLWAKSQTGTLTYEPSNFSINSLIENIIQLLKSNMVNKNISLSLDCDKNYEVFLDERMVDTIFRNLISNSIKFTKEGGAIKVCIYSELNKIKILIADNGIGITPELLEKLFKVNNHGSSRGTNGESGSGLGLILCKEFVELNKGTIEVETIINKGTTFTVSFPYFS